MKHKYLLLISLMLVQFFSFAQCNYEKSLISYCSPGYYPRAANYSLKINVPMGNDFLYAGTIKCSSSDYMNKAEFVLTNSCGDTIKTKHEEYRCASNYCVDVFKLFPHSSDTAWLVQTGEVFKLFKVTRQLTLIPVLNLPSFTEKVFALSQMPNGNIALLFENAGTSIIRVYKTDGTKFGEYDSSPKATNGFWISNFFDRKLIGHSISNPNSFLEIRLNNEGLIQSDTLLMNSPKTLYPNLYCFSEEIPGVPRFVSIGGGSQVSIYPINGQTLGVAEFTQETFVEKSFSHLQSLKVFDGGDILLQASPETYLWTKDGNLITCIPSNASYIKPGGTSSYNLFYENQGIHVTKQPYPFPGNSIVHVAGTLKAVSAGWGGQPVQARYSGFTCYTRPLSDDVTFTGLPDTITKFPFIGFVAINLTNKIPWDVEWIVNKNTKYPTNLSGIFRDIKLLESDLNGPLDISLFAAGVYCLKVKSTQGNFNYRLVSAK